MSRSCDQILTLEAHVMPVIQHVRNEHIVVVKHNSPHVKDFGFRTLKKQRMSKK